MNNLSTIIVWPGQPVPYHHDDNTVDYILVCSHMQDDSLEMYYLPYTSTISCYHSLLSFVCQHV